MVLNPSDAAPSAGAGKVWHAWLRWLTAQVHAFVSVRFVVTNEDCPQGCYTPVHRFVENSTPALSSTCAYGTRVPELIDRLSSIAVNYVEGRMGRYMSFPEVKESGTFCSKGCSRCSRATWCWFIWARYRYLCRHATQYQTGVTERSLFVSFHPDHRSPQVFPISKSFRFCVDLLVHFVNAILVPCLGVVWLSLILRAAQTCLRFWNFAFFQTCFVDRWDEFLSFAPCLFAHFLVF